MARIELNEQDIEQVVGGAFNWYYDSDGSKHCSVDNIGDYQVTPDAKDRFIALKLAHKGQGWTAQDYVNALVNEGKFH